MKSLSSKMLWAAMLALPALLGSCSKEIASTRLRTDRLFSQQMLVHNKTVPVQSAPVCNDEPQQAIIASRVVSSPTQSCNQTEGMRPEGQVQTKKIRAQFVQKLAKTAGHEIMKQATNMVATVGIHHIASITRASHQEGMLGIAGVCLIVAIALAVFGLIHVGTLFWYLAGVMIIAAIVFFLLYLVAKATGPSTP